MHRFTVFVPNHQCSLIISYTVFSANVWSLRVRVRCTYLKQNRTLCLWKMQAFLSICYPAEIDESSCLPIKHLLYNYIIICKFFTVYLFILFSVFISSDFYVLISGSGRPLFSAWLASYIHFSFSSTVACYVLHWTRRQKCDHSVTSTRGSQVIKF